MSEPQTDDPWHRGHWMQTWSGVAYYATAPAPEDVRLEDIAHSLSLQCRYNGHTDVFYSVAEHCWHVSRAVPHEDQVMGFLHDAAEAYVGDMVRPLKRQIPEFSLIENVNLRAIFNHFNRAWSGNFPDSVHEADNRILLDERAQLLTHAPPPMPWGIEGMEPLGVKIRGWTPHEAEQHFLQRAHELGLGRSDG